MPAPVKMFEAWSYSRYKDHVQCPRYAHWKHILKKPQRPPGPAMQRGRDIHKDAEDFVRGAVRRLPPTLKIFAGQFSELRKKKAIAEGKWAVTRKWQVTEYFNMAAAWLRVVLDAHYCPTRTLARVIDYKTGRMYDDYGDQLELYAATGFAHYPNADECETQIWYLDQPLGKDNPRTKTFRRSQMAGIQRKWNAKVIPILTDRKFVPRPGNYCGRCDFSKRNGGECQY